MYVTSRAEHKTASCSAESHAQARWKSGAPSAGYSGGKCNQSWQLGKLRWQCPFWRGHLRWSNFLIVFMGSGTPLINWRPIWHRICRRNCVKWLDVKWTFRISDFGHGHQRQAMENIHICIYRVFGKWIGGNIECCRLNSTSVENQFCRPKNIGSQNGHSHMVSSE